MIKKKTTPSRPHFRRGAPRKEAEHRINEYIRAPHVRITLEGEAARVFTLEEALAVAKQQGLDLVEIAPDADPPVCRIVDYSRFLYEQKKKQKEIKAKQVKTLLKEIRLSPRLGEHDFSFKLTHAKAFLEEGHKVTVLLMFKGREMAHQEIGEAVVKKFIESLAEVGVPEAPFRKEGKKILVTIAPNKKKK